MDLHTDLWQHTAECFIYSIQGIMQNELQRTQISSEKSYSTKSTTQQSFCTPRNQLINKEMNCQTCQAVRALSVWGHLSMVYSSRLQLLF